MDKSDEVKQIPRPDFFFPENDLYIEHWALTKQEKAPEWFEGENPTEEYKKGMNYKKAQFQKQEKYKLIETQSWEYKKEPRAGVVLAPELHEDF